MDHRGSTTCSKPSSRAASSPKPRSLKTSLCSTLTSLAPSARAKSPAQNSGSRSQSPNLRAPSPARPSPAFEDTLKRMKAFEEKSHLTFEKTRLFLEQQQALELLSDPPNVRSQQLAAGVPHIEKRVEAILETREKRREALSQLSTERRHREEMKEVIGTPKTVSKPRRLMSPEQFFEYTEQWAESVAKKKENIKKTLESKEKAEITFTPKVNDKKPQRALSPLYTRVGQCLTTRDAKVKCLARTLTPTFTPQTNVRKPKEVSTPRSSATPRSGKKVEFRLPERPQRSPLRTTGKEPRSSLSVLKSLIPELALPRA